ncbi:MAG: hypothetical protein Q8L78_04520 [Coxiellaceae bacterium]|nr:hypothetical protein [Coxiellaceae bacterium]
MNFNKKTLALVLVVSCGALVAMKEVESANKASAAAEKPTAEKPTAAKPIAENPTVMNLPAPNNTVAERSSVSEATIATANTKKTNVLAMNAPAANPVVMNAAAINVSASQAAATKAAATKVAATNNTPIKKTKYSNNQKTTVETLSDGTIIKKSGKNITVILPPLTKQELVAQAHNSLVTTGAGSPTASIAAPNAFGGGGTIIFANGSYVNHWPQTSVSDGFGGAGISVGNPYKYVAALISVNLASLGFNENAFGSNSGISLRLNHYFNPTTAIAIGAGNLIGWGTANGLSKNYYASLTKAFYLGIPMSINVGAGSGALNNSLVATNSDGNIYPFASAGFTLFKNFSAIADWTSRQVNLGGTYTLVCIPKVPIFFGAYAMNVAGYQNTKTFFQGTVGLSYQF